MAQIRISRKLANEPLFRAAWLLIEDNPTGSETIKAVQDCPRTVNIVRDDDVPQPMRRALAGAKDTLPYPARLAETEKRPSEAIITVFFERIRASWQLETQGRIRMRWLRPHTELSLVTSVVHHELVHVISSRELGDAELDELEKKWQPQESAWKSRNGRQLIFLTYLRIAMASHAGGKFLDAAKTPWNAKPGVQIIE